VGGLLCPFPGAVPAQESWAPSNAMLPVPWSTSVSSGVLNHPAVWPQQTWAEKWGLLCSSPWRSWSPSNSMVWAEANLCTKCHLDPSSRLATTEIGQKLWGSVPLLGELSLHLTQCGLSRGLPLIPSSVLIMQPFNHNIVFSRILWEGCCAPF